jgi:hypothetical protein
MRAWIATVMIVALTLVGCLNEENFRSEMLPRVSFELGCPPDQLVVTRIGDESFGVSGCGRRAVYMYVPRIGYVNNIGVQSDVARAPAPAASQTGESSTVVHPAEPPPVEEFVVVPLRVVLLRGHGDASTAFATEVPSIVEQINKIFVVAGVFFDLEGPPETVELAGDLPWQHSGLKGVVPGARQAEGFRLIVVRDLDANGAGLGGGDIVVQERPGLRLVPGPVAHPVARVAAHLLGGELGLTSSRYPSTLMALGTTGTLLDAPSVSTLHAAAKQVRGAKSFDEAVRTGAFPAAVAAIRAHVGHSS